ncbi:uncharacterized protein LOC125177751 [Hyalella azteca]|uniref:Uncharacterized protein LOC125177751 n=1 Tax=Hyalella azteca TaxID=294128 RepID=A0A979FH63_HYAAZ|nr:uncharacterized protein LOC125177751 [Hyalella azteca]
MRNCALFGAVKFAWFMPILFSCGYYGCHPTMQRSRLIMIIIFTVISWGGAIAMGSYLAYHTRTHYWTVTLTFWAVVLAAAPFILMLMNMKLVNQIQAKIKRAFHERWMRSQKLKRMPNEQQPTSDGTQNGIQGRDPTFSEASTTSLLGVPSPSYGSIMQGQPALHQPIGSTPARTTGEHSTYLLYEDRTPVVASQVNAKSGHRKFSSNSPLVPSFQNRQRPGALVSTRLTSSSSVSLPVSVHKNEAKNTKCTLNSFSPTRARKNSRILASIPEVSYEGENEWQDRFKETEELAESTSHQVAFNDNS